MSERRILVLNPNSNPTVTAGIEEAVADQQEPGGLVIECETLESGPFGIESDQDVAFVKPRVLDHIAERLLQYDGFVIACYSDPALAECRERFPKPVVGIHESAVTLAASYGRNFGVLALGRESIQRHIGYVRELGLQSFHAGERPLNITVDEAANDPATLDKIIETSKELISEDGAEIIILGCAGMATHRAAAQSALGIPVIDPVQAAVTMIREVA